MSFFKRIPSGRRMNADFAVVLRDDSFSPCFKAGQTVYLQRTADLRDGDVGLFRARGGLVFRQFCQDIRGTVYLFSLDRSSQKDDLEFPPDGDMPICYGKAILCRLPELPVE